MSKNYIKHTLLLGYVALLAACGAQVKETASKTTKTNGQTINATNTTDGKLLASLAATYPNGQLPAALKAQADIALAQNPAALLKTVETSLDLSKQIDPSIAVQPQATATDFQPVQRIQNASLYGGYFLVSTHQKSQPHCQHIQTGT